MGPTLGQSTDDEGHSMTNPSATPGGFAPLARHDGWARRTMQPATMLKIARAPYKGARDLPGYADWQLLVSTFDAATRARVDDDVLREHIVRGLVDEIIFAAGPKSLDRDHTRDPSGTIDGGTSFGKMWPPSGAAKGNRSSEAVVCRCPNISD